MTTLRLLLAAATLTALGTAWAADQPAPPEPQQLTRADVHARAVEARRNGTLPETEADMDVAQTKKQYAK